MKGSLLYLAVATGLSLSSCGSLFDKDEGSGEVIKEPTVDQMRAMEDRWGSKPKPKSTMSSTYESNQPAQSSSTTTTQEIQPERAPAPPPAPAPDAQLQSLPQVQSLSPSPPSSPGIPQLPNENTLKGLR